MGFRVLGPLELWFDGRRVDIGAARQRAALALLLIHANRPVGRDQLIDALWPDRPPASAAGTLHSLVHRLRTFLSACGVSGETLDRSSIGYTLRVAPEAVDLYQFEQLTADGRQALDAEDFQTAIDRISAALALWRGDAFAGVDVAAVQERAAALNEHRLEVGEWCLAAELGLGNHERVLSELQTLTAEHPYRERLWELLMTALYRSGRQADALDAYQRLYRLLDDELGIQPRSTVRQLHQQILAGAPELETVSAQRFRPDQPAPRMLPTSIRDFTGRADQVNALDALLPETEEPAPRAVIASIAGPGGIGKTTLAVHWGHQVADRFPDGQLYMNLRGFDPSRRAHVHNTLCWIFDLQKSYNEALEHAQQAHKLFQIAGHLVGQAAALNNIGWYHAKRGHYRQALTCCRQALNMYQELGDHDGKGAAWDSIGYALYHLGHNQFAITCYHRAYHLHREAGERHAQAETLDRLGDTQHAVGDHPAARHSWRRALDLLDELHHPDAEPVRAKLAASGLSGNGVTAVHRVTGFL